MNPILPVLIVGAGPTGLAMACALHRYGVAFRIIDKLPAPISTSNALAMQPRTMEVLDDMGLISEALSRGIPLRSFNLHCSAEKKLSFDFSELDTFYRFILGIAQRETEDILRTHLKDLGVSVEMSVELTQVREINEGVEVVLKHPEGREELVNTSWLIACDGGHSTVRTQLNIPFEGRKLEEHFVMADVILESEFPHEAVHAFLSPHGPFVFIAFDKQHSRLIMEVTRDKELYRATSLNLAQIERLIAERCPAHLKIKEILWTSGFWINERLIRNYRQDRIFFAGDAAHQHSPVGGQGMNTGIQDAYNLAWKLAFVIQGKAAPSILETYEMERRPIAKKVLEGSTFMTHVVSLRSRFLRFIRNHLFGWFLASKKIRLLIQNTLSELAISYEKSPLVWEELPKSSGQGAGQRVLDVQFEAQARLFDYLRGPHMTLLLFSGLKGKQEILNIYYQSINHLLEKKGLKIIFVTTKDGVEAPNGVTVLQDKQGMIHQKYDVQFPTAYLIRPDKYIGFRGGESHAQALLNYILRI